MLQTHPNAAQIVTDFEAWGDAANDGRADPRQAERARQWVELRAKAPLQSKGKSVEDPAHLPLFVAVNEPELLL